MNGCNVIVRVDGGICSQIAFVALGLWLERRFGATVKYDLSWFSEWGKDMNGVFVRNWDMGVAFPGLGMEIATNEEVQWAKRHGILCKTLDACIDSCSSSLKKSSLVYVCGYPDRNAALISMADFLRKKFSPVLDDRHCAVLDDILNSESCAVHVRRGDLATADPYYGNPTSSRYFSDAIKCVKGFCSETKFFFFSDEPDWCEQNLLPLAGGSGKVCRLNGSDKGYLDLFLISRCKRIISSQGSLGVFGAFFLGGGV